MSESNSERGVENDNHSPSHTNEYDTHDSTPSPNFQPPSGHGPERSGLETNQNAEKYDQGGRSSSEETEKSTMPESTGDDTTVNACENSNNAENAVTSDSETKEPTTSENVTDRGETTSKDQEKGEAVLEGNSANRDEQVTVKYLCEREFDGRVVKKGDNTYSYYCDQNKKWAMTMGEPGHHLLNLLIEQVKGLLEICASRIFQAKDKSSEDMNFLQTEILRGKYIYGSKETYKKGSKDAATWSEEEYKDPAFHFEYLKLKSLQRFTENYNLLERCYNRGMFDEYIDCKEPKRVCVASLGGGPGYELFAFKCFANKHFSPNVTVRLVSLDLEDAWGDYAISMGNEFIKWDLREGIEVESYLGEKADFVMLSYVVYHYMNDENSAKQMADLLERECVKAILINSRARQLQSVNFAKKLRIPVLELLYSEARNRDDRQVAYLHNSFLLKERDEKISLSFPDVPYMDSNKRKRDPSSYDNNRPQRFQKFNNHSERRDGYSNGSFQGGNQNSRGSSSSHFRAQGRGERGRNDYRRGNDSRYENERGRGGRPMRGPYYSSRNSHDPYGDYDSHDRYERPRGYRSHRDNGDGLDREDVPQSMDYDRRYQGGRDERGWRDRRDHPRYDPHPSHPFYPPHGQYASNPSNPSYHPSYHNQMQEHHYQFNEIHHQHTVPNQPVVPQGMPGNPPPYLDYITHIAYNPRPFSNDQRPDSNYPPHNHTQFYSGPPK